MVMGSIKCNTFESAKVRKENSLMFNKELKIGVETILIKSN